MADIYEKNLIEGAKKGKEQDFEALVLMYQDTAYNVAYKYFQNHEDALDATQESFIKVFKNIKKFRQESSFKTWLYRIVMNTCNDIFRSRKATAYTESIFKEGEEGEYIVQLEDKDKGPLERIISHEESSRLMKSLYKLPKEQKEILILRDMEDLSYEEIGFILSINLGTVKSRINRARLKLREVYIEDGGTL